MAYRQFRLFVLFLFVCLAAAGVRAAAAAGEEDHKVNVNTAAVSELTTLHRIGPATAEKIVAYREEHGPFKKVEDLLGVRGIGPKTLEGFREKVTVGEGAGKPAKPKPAS